MKPQTQEVHGTLLEDISAAPDTEGPKNPPEHPGPFSPGRCRKLCADAPRKAGSHGDSAWSTAWRAASKAHRMGCPSTHLLLRLIPPGPPAKVSSRCKMKTRSLPLDSSCLKETPQSLPPPCSTARAGQCLPQGRIWPSWRHSWVSQLGRMLLTSTGTSTHDPAHPVRHRPPPPRHASPCWGSPDAGRAQGRACNHSALPPPRQRLQLGAPTLGLVPRPGENPALGTEAVSSGRGLQAAHGAWGSPGCEVFAPGLRDPGPSSCCCNTGKSRSELGRGVPGWGPSLPPSRTPRRRIPPRQQLLRHTGGA